MFIEVYDDDQPAVVWLFAGRANAEGDHARWLAAMLRLDGALRGRLGGALLIIDDGNPPPPAALRTEIAKVARQVTGRTPLAVVTSSLLARGIIAGLNTGGIVDFAIKGFAAAPAAVAWLAARANGVEGDILHGMVDEARQKASRSAS